MILRLIVPIYYYSYKTKYLNDQIFHNFCAMRAVESTEFHKLLTLSLFINIIIFIIINGIM